MTTPHRQDDGLLRQEILHALGLAHSLLPNSPDRDKVWLALLHFERAAPVSRDVAEGAGNYDAQAAVGTRAPPQPAPDALRVRDDDDFLTQARKTIGHLSHAVDALSAAPDAMRSLLEALLPYIRAGDVSKGEPSFYYDPSVFAVLSPAPVPPADDDPEPACEPFRYKTTVDEEGFIIGMVRGCPDCGKDLDNPDEPHVLDCESLAPLPAVAGEAVSDERAVELAHQICTGKLSAVQGAVEIMQYATDAVLQIQAASRPVRGERETIARTLFKNRSKFDDKTTEEWFRLYAENPKQLGEQYLSVWWAYSDADALQSSPAALSDTSGASTGDGK